MRPPETSVRPTPRTLLWDLLTFDRLLTGPILHLIYWAGIGLIVLMGFGVVGAAIGIALRDVSIASVLLAIPVLVGGLLVTAALLLLWRGLCEFFMAVFRIAEDLSHLRAAAERDAVRTRASASPPPTNP